MLVDALLAADPVLKMTERIHDPREFVKMDDTLLKQVENYGMLHPGWESTEDHGPISEAQTIITRSDSSCQDSQWIRHLAPSGYTRNCCPQGGLTLLTEHVCSGFAMSNTAAV